jgi:hypothetical protein
MIKTRAMRMRQRPHGPLSMSPAIQAVWNANQDREILCRLCEEGRRHSDHCYKGCTCKAGGAHEEHAGHCALYGAMLIHDDSLLSA